MFLPVQPHQFSENFCTRGIETLQIDGVPVKIYNMEKIPADCFKFRNKIGMNIFLEAFRFVPKGALTLRIWDAPEISPTMDIDMLVIASNKESEVINQVRDILAVDAEPDGLFFDPDSMKNERITEDADSGR